MAVPFDVQHAADQAGAIAHRSQSHASLPSVGALPDGGVNSDAVIAHFEDNVFILAQERNVDTVRLTVAHGVVQGFLRDAIHVLRRRVAQHCNRTGTVETAANIFLGVGRLGQVVERRSQTLGVDLTGMMPCES